MARLLDDSGPVTPDAGRTALRRARRQLVTATLAPRSLPATWAQRRTIAPAGRSAGPLGLRTRGAVVALVGTDGSGKSSVSSALAAELAELGVPTRSVYFGMARGNLPGVTLARRLSASGRRPARSSRRPSRAGRAGRGRRT